MTRCPIPSAPAALLAAVACAAILGACGERTPDGDSPDSASQRSSMKLTSAAFDNGQPLPAEFTCDGAGTSPSLQWSEPPAGTESFALVVDDPDAPGGTFGHWGVYDIPMSARQINTGAAASGTSGLVQARNDFGQPGYGPPCPPKGDEPHHYHFRLLALDFAKFDKAPANVEGILDVGDSHILGRAELVATYKRK